METTIEKRKVGRPKGSFKVKNVLDAPRVRKPGSGRIKGSKNKNPKQNQLKGSQKLYALLDPRQGVPQSVEDLNNRECYIGLTTQWLCKRLEYHIYCAKRLNQQSKRDIWVLELLKSNTKPIIYLIENLTSNISRKEALIKENELINKYGNLNTGHNTFIGKRQPTGNYRIFKNDILKLAKEGYCATEIANTLGCSISSVGYWLAYLHINKKTRIQTDCQAIQAYLQEGKNIKTIQNLLNLTHAEMRYRLTKLNMGV